jgi:hypothetical protein
MTLQEAERINGLCLDHSLWRMGLRPKPDSLADYTLLQLIEARDIVKADSDERMKQPGPKRLPAIGCWRPCTWPITTPAATAAISSRSSRASPGTASCRSH